MTENKFDTVTKTIQVLAVVVGVVISVLSLNNTRQHEAYARHAEAQKQQVEAAKPFLDLRQRLYLETLQQAAILASPEVHTKDEIDKAGKRFRDLYVSELSMVEARSVEGAMVQLADQIAPDLRQMTPKQQAAFALSHAVRDSLVDSWKLDRNLVDNPE